MEENCDPYITFCCHIFAVNYITLHSKQYKIKPRAALPFILLFYFTKSNFLFIRRYKLKGKVLSKTNVAICSKR